MILNNEETSSPHFLLIGASRGIGLAMAEELLRRGWQVTATMRAAAPALASLALRYGQALTTEQLDITDEAQLAALRHRLRHQRFSALFVNAGTTNQDQNQTIAEVSTEEFAHLMHRLLRLRIKTAGGDKQAAGEAAFLHLFAQHMIARQQLLLAVELLAEQNLTPPAVDLLPVIAQRIVKHGVAVGPERFQLRQRHVAVGSQLR